MKVYLSSTFTDLKRHRAILGHALRKADCDVVMMEEYAARDQTVEFACQGDVVECDIYIGVFAWRHGHIPADNNPEQLSVTEMEYAAAGAKPMTRLTFLLKEKARWPKDRVDPDPVRIKSLRARLEKQCSAYFTNADELAVEVLAALRVHESTHLTQQLEAIKVILDAQAYGASYMENIKGKLGLLGEATFVEICIGDVPWWISRLYLVASLAQEFGRVQGLVFVDKHGAFLLMATPLEISHRLGLRWPALNQVYRDFRQEVTLEILPEKLWRYSILAVNILGEKVAKHELSVRDIEYELGISRNADIVDVRDKGQLFLQREILGRQAPYVALVRDHILEGIVDRQILTQRVAEAVHTSTYAR